MTPLMWLAMLPVVSIKKHRHTHCDREIALAMASTSRAPALPILATADAVITVSGWMERESSSSSAMLASRLCLKTSESRRSSARSDDESPARPSLRPAARPAAMCRNKLGSGPALLLAEERDDADDGFFGAFFFVITVSGIVASRVREAEAVAVNSWWPRRG